jgi:hypothetical protein
MKICLFAFSMMILLWAGRLPAQVPAVVQLPSYSVFGVSTTVSVPDRGSISLGGVGRSSSGYTAFGPALGPGNRAFGRNTSASSATLHATIHDFDALDRATLDRAARRHRLTNSAGSLGMSAHSRLAASRSTADTMPEGSVADAERRRRSEVAAKQREARDELAHARRAAEQGKTSVAKIFYHNAARRASGPLKETIEREAAELASPVPSDWQALTKK